MTDRGSIAFPDFDDGRNLQELIDQVATALATTSRRPVGSPLELLVAFTDYPDQFQLWWDGFTCELGCSEQCGLTMDAIWDRLLASGSFSTPE